MSQFVISWQFVQPLFQLDQEVCKTSISEVDFQQILENPETTTKFILDAGLHKVYCSDVGRSERSKLGRSELC